MSRFGRAYAVEDEAARLLTTRKKGFVAVWPDGSVSWHGDVPLIHDVESAPITRACDPSIPGAGARAWYTNALREHFKRDQDGGSK